MNPDWKEFLQNQGARFDDANVATFNGELQLPECALFDLSYLGLIQLEGEDAVDFMQGQFTNDSREISVEASQMSGFCSPKGRMLALFRIIEHNGTYLLQLPIAVLEGVKKRLQMFVLRSKVTITDAGNDLVSLGLAGSCAEELLQDLFPSVPTETDQAVNANGITCVRMGGAVPRFQLIVAADQAADLWKKLSIKAQATNSTSWKLLSVRAGEPIVHSETIEAFVPQMTNMQLVNGLSFKKGCYTGQEVVARMQYLGKLKRRMFHARIDSNDMPSPGDDLFSGESSSGQGAGRIVEAAPSPDGGHEVLAVIEISSQESNDVHLGSIEGPQLQFLELPYAFESKDD